MRVRPILAVVLLLAVRAAFAVDVTECGQVIEANQVGQLRNDLQCAAGPTWPFSAEGIYLRPGAKLELNGFTIAGDGTGTGVVCGMPGARFRPCTIEGPGEVREFWAGVNCGGCTVVVRDAAINAHVNGIYIPLAGKLIARRVVANDNERSGIWADRVRATDVEASRNGDFGVGANATLRLERLAATANGAPGVRGGIGRGRIVDSVITGNDTAGEGYDIVSVGDVRLTGTTCGRSGKLRYLSQDEFEIVGSFGCAGD